MATWTNEDIYSGAPSIAVNASVSVNSASYNVNGQLVTAWTNENES